MHGDLFALATSCVPTTQPTTFMCDDFLHLKLDLYMTTRFVHGDHFVFTISCPHHLDLCVTTRFMHSAYN